MAEEKRKRRTAAEMKQDRKEKYLKDIENHKKAIADLEQKLKDLDKPPKLTANQKRDILAKEVKKRPLEEVAKALGINFDNYENS